MNTLNWKVTTNLDTKCFIETQDEAREQGRWDAENGLRCNPDAYAYPNDARRPYLRGDYVYAYMLAKGL